MCFTVIILINSLKITKLEKYYAMNSNIQLVDLKKIAFYVKKKLENM